MKQILTAACLTLLAALSLTAQTSPAIKCKGSDTHPCTAKQVQALADAVAAGKQQHDVLAAVRNITLASPDGILKCDQTDGMPCTTAQFDAVKIFAADQKLFLTYIVKSPN
jgi:hypothetical protein